MGTIHLGKCDPTINTSISVYEDPTSSKAVLSFTSGSEEVV